MQMRDALRGFRDWWRGLSKRRGVHLVTPPFPCPSDPLNTNFPSATTSSKPLTTTTTTTDIGTNQPLAPQPPPPAPSPSSSTTNPPLHTNLTTPNHSNPQTTMSLSHLSLPITSLPLSRTFYTATLAPLNIHLIFDSTTASPPSTSKTPTLGYGPDPAHEILNLFELGDEALPAGQGFHLAFHAPSREAVVEFHAAAMASGGRDNGLPGVRKAYGERYFAAFVVDPDGWRLEAVCKT